MDRMSMSNGKKNKKRRRSSYALSCTVKKKRNKASSKRRKNVRFHGELEDMDMDMKKLSSNNEVFHCRWETVRDVVYAIRSQKTPTYNKYRRWGVYGVSFYLKMCDCFGVDYQHLEEATPPEPEKPTPPSTKEECNLKQEKHTDCTQPSTQQMTDEERHEKEINEKILNAFWEVDGPFEFGYYLCGTRADRIPYHLYKLVKEAVDIMNSTNDQTDLELVETKIYFFCHYLHSHLPTDWEYRRENASSLIASGYESTQFSRASYVPIRDLAEENATDTISCLRPRAMADIMSIIYSRKTPSFWDMGWSQICFYCKLCSCFGIDYQRLEAASKDDVCLMNVGY